MAKRPTIADLAKRSGLSVATVDRALNGRHRVREETLKRLYDASTALGYHGTSLLRQRIRQEMPEYRLGFLLLGETHPVFFQALADSIEQAAAEAPECRCSVKTEIMDWRVPGDAAEQLRDMGSRVQAIGAIAVDHPTITAAVAELRSKGVPVFSLLSDFAQGVRESYVGLNNRKAGRTAAWLIAETAPKPGKVAIFVGSSRFHGHEMREIGFRAYFREHAPEFEVIDTVVNPGYAHLAYDATKDLLRRHDDLVGLNVASFGPDGVIMALREKQMAGRLAAVCGENTAQAAAALADRIITMVINTPLDRFSRELIALMVSSIRDGAARLPGQVFIPFDIVVGESL